MRHKYQARAIVLARAPLGEANTSVTLLTDGLGLVYARAQGLRHPRAKLAAALATFAESEVTLVRGKEGWRVAGAILAENWFGRLSGVETRRRAARVCGLLLRLVAGESRDAQLYPILAAFFGALAQVPTEAQDSAEVLAALRLLAALGLDAGTVPGAPATFGSAELAEVAASRPALIARINTGITASGL